MKKATKWLILILFLIMVVTGGAGIHLIQKDGGFDRRIAISEDRDFDLSGANAILLENNMADIFVTFSDTAQARASLSGKSLEGDYTFVTENRNSGYYIKLYQKSGGLFFDFSAAELRLTLPKSYRGSIVVKNASGGIQMDGHMLSFLDLASSVGDVTLGEITADKLRINASDGNIRAGALTVASSLILQTAKGDITAGPLRCPDIELYSGSKGDIMIGGIENAAVTLRSTSGKSALTGLKNADLDLRSTAGDIEISYLEFQNPVTVEAASGDIALTLPRDAAFHLNAIANLGITCDFSLTQTEKQEKTALVGTVGTGGSELSLRSGAGKINLYRTMDGTE